MVRHKYKWAYCEKCGKRTTHHTPSGLCICPECEMGLEDTLNDSDMELLQSIKSSKLSPEELRLLLKTKPKPVKTQDYQAYVGKDHMRIGIVSDLHIGSSYFKGDYVDFAKKEFDKEKVDAIWCPGDILEGMSGRDGHIYECDYIGYSAQLKEAIKQLSKFKQPFLFILGNHDLWAKNKMNMGLNIGEELQEKLPNAKYLGDMEATIDVGHGRKVKLTHRGSTAYALSYSGQKMINGLEGGSKPDAIINGHIHKSMYFNYRNIHYLEAGTLQNQTEFMAMKGAPAMPGFWIIDMWVGKDGINKFSPTWYPIRLKK